MYKRTDDPYEETTIAATADPNLVSRLVVWLNALRNCAWCELPRRRGHASFLRNKTVTIRAW